MFGLFFYGDNNSGMRSVGVWSGVAFSFYCENSHLIHRELESMQWTSKELFTCNPSTNEAVDSMILHDDDDDDKIKVNFHIPELLLPLN